MPFIKYLKEFKEPEKKVLVENKSLPRNFKSYMKRITSQPVIVLCSGNPDLISECNKNSIKYYLLTDKRYLIESQNDKILIKNMFDENGLIYLNKKNTFVVKDDSQLSEKLKKNGLVVLEEQEIKEKLNESSK